MKLVRPNYHPVKDVFQDFFNTAVNRSIADIFGNDSAMTQPSVNILETADDFKLDVAAPGLEKSDFNISVEDNKLMISAQKEYNKEETTDKFTRKEFNYSSFTRSFDLPDFVDSEQIKAGYENGILRLTLPKKPEAKSQPQRTIEIS